MNAVRNAQQRTGVAGLSGGVVDGRRLLCVAAGLLFTLIGGVGAALAASSGAPADNPRLSSVQIEIWPEFDRPAALVILKGELGPDVKLPASVSVRIPATSGGPAAVAFSAAAGGELLTAQFESVAAGDRIALQFAVPQRFFHVEFYAPIATTAAGRKFAYLWPGDFATDKLAVIVQEPAGASGFGVTPVLAATATGQNGLTYRSAELGAFPVGKQLDVSVQYTKTDARTSTEILNPRAADAQTAAAQKAAAPPAPRAADSAASPFPIPSKQAAMIWLAGVVAVLALGGIGAALWSYRRRGTAGAPGPGSGTCRKCKAPLVAGARFCAACGARQA